MEQQLFLLFIFRSPDLNTKMKVVRSLLRHLRPHHVYPVLSSSAEPLQDQPYKDTNNDVYLSQKEDKTKLRSPLDIVAAPKPLMSKSTVVPHVSATNPKLFFVYGLYLCSQLAVVPHQSDKDFFFLHVLILFGFIICLQVLNNRRKTHPDKFQYAAFNCSISSSPLQTNITCRLWKLSPQITQKKKFVFSCALTRTDTKLKGTFFLLRLYHYLT